MSDFGKEIIEGLEDLLAKLQNGEPIEVTKLVRQGGKVKIITGKTDKPYDVEVREETVDEDRLG